MEKSPSYYRRKELMEKLEVPLMSEVKKEFGEQLSSVIFEQCPDALQEKMGLRPKLKGAGNTLWTSPSDLLLGKVCLKPPLTNKHMKALTHEGILDIGQDIDRRYWEQMEAEKEAALKEQEAYLKKVADCERYVAVKRAIEEEKAKCAEKILELMLEFEKRLQEELQKLEQEMLLQQELMLAEAKASIEAEWQLKLEEAVRETVERLTIQFLEDLETQKNELMDGFRIEFQNQHLEYEYAMKEEQSFCKDALKQLKHWLECKNISNLVYVLCMERKKCEKERCIIETSYKTKVNELETLIKDRNAEINLLTEDRDNKQRQVNVREECVLEILRQFQKFINFTLRAIPTQAEFLLSIEKMMLFEFAQACVTPKNIKTLARVILPWKSDSQITSSSEESDVLVPKDYHQCRNEAPSPDGADESNVVPAVYYDGNMYVREDFRNMFSQGLEMSETNLLWNRDVNNLMKILRASRTDLREEQKTAEEGIDGIRELLVEELPETGSKRSSFNYTSKKKMSPMVSRRGSILKKPKASQEGDVYSSMQSIEEKLNEETFFESKPFSVQTLPTPTTSVHVDHIKNEVSPLTIGLLATKDSLVKMRESRRSSFKGDFYPNQDEIETDNMLMAVRESLQQHDKPNKIQSLVEGGVVSFQDFDAIRIPDQIILGKQSSKSSKTSIVKMQKSLEKSILVQNSNYAPTKSHSVESKLVYAKDSLIIHKSSCIGSPPKSEYGPKRGSKLSFHRNSLELIRKMSLHSSLKVDAHISETLMVGTRLMSKESVHEFEKVKRIVSPSTVSHREIFKIPENAKDALVNFSPVREVFETNSLNVVDSPWKLYDTKDTVSKVPESRENFLNKPGEVKIIGDPTSVEYKQSSPEFTMKRINSIMDILRDEPSLIKLFTSCTK